MKHAIHACLIAVSAMGYGVALAADSGGGPTIAAKIQAALTGQPTVSAPTTGGQPGQTCGSATAPNTPGQAVSAPGSAFNPNGTAGGVYAGNQPVNSNNPKSVSQYDVACFEQPF